MWGIFFSLSLSLNIIVDCCVCISFFACRRFQILLLIINPFKHTFAQVAHILLRRCEVDFYAIADTLIEIASLSALPKPFVFWVA